MTTSTKAIKYIKNRDVCPQCLFINYFYLTEHSYIRTLVSISHMLSKKLSLEVEGVKNRKKLFVFMFDEEIICIQNEDYEDITEIIRDINKKWFQLLNIIDGCKYIIDPISNLFQFSFFLFLSDIYFRDNQYKWYNWVPFAPIFSKIYSTAKSFCILIYRYSMTTTAIDFDLPKNQLVDTHSKIKSTRNVKDENNLVFRVS